MYLVHQSAIQFLIVQDLLKEERKEGERGWRGVGDVDRPDMSDCSKLTVTSSKIGVFVHLAS